MYVTIRILMLAGFAWCLLGSEVVQAQCETQKLIASDGAPFDAFGVDVAISGNIAVIGAMNQDNPGNNLGFGKGYVFEFDGAQWAEVAQLTPFDPEPDKEFGNDVAIDGETIVVGAGQDGGGIGVGSGAAYVFERIDGVWPQMAKLTASDAAANDYFSSGLGISGDVIVVGALNNQDFGNETGSAYIFEKPSEGWGDMTETQKLLASDATAGDRFGHSAAIDGNTVVIGADQINTGPGKAYIFERQSGIWVETAMLTASDAEMQDSFGYDVAIRGETVVVGAFRDDDIEINSGSAYVFVRPPDTGWVNMTQTCKLRALAPGAHDNFGFSVSISIFDTVLVGANAEENSSSPGSAYLFEKAGGECVDGTETAKLLAFDGAPGDRFGNSVSIDTNIGVVGAHRQDKNGTPSGAAYVFPCLGVPIPTVSKWGLIVMTLLVLTAGTVVLKRRPIRA